MLLKTCGAWIMIAAAPHVGAQTPSPAPPGPPSTPAGSSDQTPVPSADQISYLFGLTFGEQMHRVGITNELIPDALTRGMREGLQGKKSTPADQRQLQEFVRSVMDTAIKRNQAAAKDFLAHNAHEKGVVTTASGLQYKIILPGDRKAPPIVPTDEVSVQYRGKLLDNSEFDSTYTRGAPVSFTVNGVIPGWQEALVLMKPGAKWQLFVPPELGYDTSPKPGIPGGSLLIFDVELLAVKSSGAPAIGAPAAPASGKSTPKSK
jgi:FKBP-type peptidyl-prolyl cis-trans isomerase FklB